MLAHSARSAFPQPAHVVGPGRGAPSLAGATKCAWPGAVWEAPRGLLPLRGMFRRWHPQVSFPWGDTSNKGGRSPPCVWSLRVGFVKGRGSRNTLPLTASLVTFCAVRKLPPGGRHLNRVDVGIDPYGCAAESAASPLRVLGIQKVTPPEGTLCQVHDKSYSIRFRYRPV